MHNLADADCWSSTHAAFFCIMAAAWHPQGTPYNAPLLLVLVLSRGYSPAASFCTLASLRLSVSSSSRISSPLRLTKHSRRSVGLASRASAIATRCCNCLSVACREEGVVLLRWHSLLPTLSLLQHMSEGMP